MGSPDAGRLVNGGLPEDYVAAATDHSITNRELYQLSYISLPGQWHPHVSTMPSAQRSVNSILLSSQEKPVRGCVY